MDSRLGQHVYGAQLGDVSHMCPECGIPVRPFCPVCLGVGHISTDRLARWQAAQNVPPAARDRRSDPDS
jgi:hypothetical protein